MPWIKMGDVPNPIFDANGDPYSGAVLKAYLPGTTTSTSIATDASGSNPQTSITANASGIWEVSGSEVVPHIDRTHKWGIFANSTDATANTPFYMGPFDNIEISNDDPPKYASVAAAKAVDLSSYDIVETLSYLASWESSVAGPRGGARYHKDGTTGTVSTVYANGDGFYDSAGNGFKISYDTEYDLYQLGSIGDASVSDVANLKNAITLGQMVRVPAGDGNAEVKFLIDAKTDLDQAYDTIISGNGDDSVFEMTTAGYLIAESNADNNRLGIRKKMTLANFTMQLKSGQTQSGSRGLVLGDDALTNSTTAAVDTKIIGVQARDFEKGVDINMVENIDFHSYRATACNYGIYCEDASNKSSSDIVVQGASWFSNNDLAGICWLSNDANVGNFHVKDTVFGSNVGWAIYCRGQSKFTNIPLVFTNLHIEANGSSSSVTVDGTARDPQQCFFESCHARFVGGFMDQTVGEGIVGVDANIHIDGMKVGGNTGANWLNLDGDSIAHINGVNWVTGAVDTDAIVWWGDKNHCSGSATTYLNCRIPDRTFEIRFPENKTTDPHFETGWTGDIGGSASNNPTLTGGSTDVTPPYGERCLKVVFNSGAGSANDNAISLYSASSLASQEFICVTFWMRTSNAAGFTIQEPTLAGPTIVTSSTNWKRYAFFVFNNGTAAAKKVWLFPTGTGGSTAYIKGLMVAQTTDFAEVEKVLQGGVEGFHEVYREVYPHLLSGFTNLAIASNFDVQTQNAVQVVIDNVVYNIGAGTADTGTSATFPAGKWGIFTVQTNTAGTLTTKWETNSSSGFDSEADAIAKLPGPDNDLAPLGYVTVQADASNSFTAGTDALQGGTGGNPSQDTNYYNVPYFW